MKNRNAFVAIVATTVLVLAGCSRKEKPIHGALPENVIAMVAATPIATATFESELNRQRGADKHAVLDRLVRRELLLAEAQRTGFAESPEIQEAWRNFVINRFAEKMQSQMEELPAPTIDELQACYQARIDLYNVPERVHIALIQLRLSPSVGAERKEALTARATALRDQAVAQAQDSKDFGVLARENSDHRRSRMSGGDVGWIEQNSMGWPVEIIEAAFALREAGEISPPVQGPDGIYLLKLMEKQESHPLPFDQVRSRVEYQLTRERAEKAEADFYASLKTTFPVVINTQQLNTVAAITTSSNIKPPRMPAR